MLQFFEQLNNIVTPIGIFLATIFSIYSFFAKPTSFFKKKRLERQRKFVESIIEETVEKIVEERFLSYNEQTEQFLDQIEKLNTEQSKLITILCRSSQDLLRQRIMTIYHTYKVDQQIPIYLWEDVKMLYKDYKDQMGNSYLDRYYERMEMWEIIIDPTYDEGIHR